MPYTHPRAGLISSSFIASFTADKTASLAVVNSGPRRLSEAPNMYV